MKKSAEQIWIECENYQIQQKKQEFITLLEYLEATNQQLKDCLEIGAYDGGTSVGFLNLFDSVVTIDIKARPNWLIIKEHYPEWINVQANTHSPNTVRFLKGLNKQFDFIFIDGDHTEEGVEMDFLVYKQFLKPGGIIAFHDILRSEYHEENNCFVHNFWDKVKKQYDHIEIIYEGEDYSGIFASKVSTRQWGGIGLLLNVNSL